MPQIYRRSGPGDHSLAGTVLVFDEAGLATSDDPEVLALVRQFPDVFTVTEVAPTEKDLEGLTVAELRERATQAGIARVSSLNKAELIDALLAAPEA